MALENDTANADPKQTVSYDDSRGGKAYEGERTTLDGSHTLLTLLAHRNW